jgi:hypothetical protein
MGGVGGFQGAVALYNTLQYMLLNEHGMLFER